MKKSPLFLFIGIIAVIYGVMLAYAGVTESIAESHGVHNESHLLPILIGIILPVIFIVLLFLFWLSFSNLQKEGR